MTLTHHPDIGPAVRPDEDLALLVRAIHQAGIVVAATDAAAQAGLPTPCVAWTVRDLVAHVVDEAHQFAREASGLARRPPGDDPLGDDWVGAYRDAAIALLGAWRRPGALDGSVRTPHGELPPTWMIGQHLTELAVHAWDLAVATGQPVDLLDDDVAEAALAWGHENLRPEYRGPEDQGFHIAPEAPTPPDATPYTRLATFTGRPT
jgi:uncharacterized protein (TIGR03086 family)